MDAVVPTLVVDAEGQTAELVRRALQRFTDGVDLLYIQYEIVSLEEASYRCVVDLHLEPADAQRAEG